MTFKAELLSEPLQVAWRKKEIKTPGAVYDYNLVAYCDGEQVGRIYHDRPREQEGFCGGIIRMFQPHVESNNKWLSKAETLADAKAALVAVLQADQAEMVEANKIISTLIFGQPALRGDGTSSGLGRKPAKGPCDTWPLIACLSNWHR
jgi:hypothetical protein